MKLAAAIVMLFGVFSFLSVGAFTDWDYTFHHKPRSQAMWAWVEYDKCRDSVREAQLKVCADLGVPSEQCPIDLSQCDKYKEKE